MVTSLWALRTKILLAGCSKQTKWITNTFPQQSQGMTEMHSCSHAVAAGFTPLLHPQLAEEHFRLQTARSSPSACYPLATGAVRTRRSPSGPGSEFKSFQRQSQSLKASSGTQIHGRSIISSTNRGVYARSVSGLPAQLDGEHLKFCFPMRRGGNLGQTHVWATPGELQSWGLVILGV